MYCRKCGKEVNDDALFCPYCGTKKLHESDNADVDVTSVQKENENTEKVAPKKGKRRKLTIGSIAVILVIAVIVGVSGLPNKQESGYYSVHLNIYNYEDYLTVASINHNYETGKYDLYISSKIKGAIFENVNIQTTDKSPNLDYTLPKNGELTIRNLIDERTYEEIRNDFGLQTFRPAFKVITGYINIPKNGK